MNINTFIIYDMTELNLDPLQSNVWGFENLERLRHVQEVFTYRVGRKMVKGGIIIDS